jgi:molecular chaperone GrpE
MKAGAMSEMRSIKVVSQKEPKKGEVQLAPSAPAGTAEPEKEERSTQPEQTPVNSAADSSTDLEERLRIKEKESQENHDRLLRVSAEFENYKKRMNREIDDVRKYANQSLLREMLSVVDHIELALQAAAENSPGAGLREGLNLTLKELLRILEKFKVKPIQAVGQAFNPEYHEAILREECAGAAGNTVLREMQKGYTIHDRLLRPSMVVVAVAANKAGADAAKDGSPGDV